MCLIVKCLSFRVRSVGRGGFIVPITHLIILINIIIYTLYYYCIPFNVQQH